MGHDRLLEDAVRGDGSVVDERDGAELRKADRPSSDGHGVGLSEGEGSDLSAEPRITGRPSLPDSVEERSEGEVDALEDVTGRVVG